MRGPLAALAVALLAGAYLAGLLATGGAIFRLGLGLQPDPRGPLARTAQYGLPDSLPSLPSLPPAAAQPAAPEPAVVTAAARVEAEVSELVPAGCAGLAGGRLQACLHGKVESAPGRPPTR